MSLRQTMLGVLVVLALPASQPVRAGEPPAWLPRYDLTMDMALAAHRIKVTMRATWTNPYTKPAHELVFNAHSRYVVPSNEVGFEAKILEILRMTPSDAKLSVAAATRMRWALRRLNAHVIVARAASVMYPRRAASARNQ